MGERDSTPRISAHRLPMSMLAAPRILPSAMASRSCVGARVDATLSGDEKDIKLWWDGRALDRVLSSIRSIRSRFTQVTEVSWTRSGEWIRVLSNTDTQATYVTSETWTFVGAIDQKCSNGSQMRRRYVESYPSQQYTLELRDGAYHIVEWQLGHSTTNDIGTFCP